MTYEEMIAWVHSAPRLAKYPGVENTKRLLEMLGNPEQKLRFVHVAGTNGKGSTTVMLASVLHHAGYRTGATVSPYVIDFRERFQINGEMIGQQALLRVMQKVYDAVQVLKQQGWESFVEFDLVTAAALVWFAESACDIVCLETGLGGQLDSTNAITDTLVCCITSIGMDHTELLGDTYAQIAKEKCGIFKLTAIVVCYPKQHEEALKTIQEQAKQKKLPLVIPDCTQLQVKSDTIVYKNCELKVPFAGYHQIYNALVVLETIAVLQQKGYQIPDKAVKQGVAQAFIPARIEVVSSNPLVIIDGAHNPDSANALAQTLQEKNQYHLVGVMGVLQGKQAQLMLKILAPHLDKLYTVTPDNPRAITAKELARLAKEQNIKAVACDSLQQAIEKAEGDLLICGSLYLVAQARKYFVP